MPLNSEERENPKAQKGAKKSGYFETALLVKKLMVFPGLDGLTPGRNLKSARHRAERRSKNIDGDGQHLLGMRVEKDDSVAGSKAWQVGEMVHGVETQAETSGFSDLQLFDRVAYVTDAFEVAV